MAKERIINTKFWGDGYISNLNPVEKLLFIYFLTNEKTNISGVYELPLKYVAMETGIDGEMVEKMLKRFEKDKKIIYRRGWLVMINFLKHQHNESDKVITGIIRELKSAPNEVILEAIGIGYAKGIDRVSKGYHILNLTKLNVTDDVKNTDSYKKKSSKTTAPRFVPVDWEKPINKRPKYFMKHRIVLGMDGKKYAIPPDGGQYILYKDLIKP